MPSCKNPFLHRVLTHGVDTVTEIGKAIMENTQRNSTLPHRDDVNPNMMMILSPTDLLAFGENARQLECVHHVMVECNNKIHKLVTNDELAHPSLCKFSFLYHH